MPKKVFFASLLVCILFVVSCLYSSNIVHASPVASRVHVSGIAKSASTVQPDFLGQTPCQGRTDFFQVYNNTGELCFFGPGGASVAIYSVYEICSGNNNADVTMTYSDGHTETDGFGHNVCVTYGTLSSPGIREITYIDLY